MQSTLNFFLDVDNTLVNNDAIKNEIKFSLEEILGVEEADIFWQKHDSFRNYNKLVDFPAIIRSYCTGKDETSCNIKLNTIIQNIKFENALYPYSLEVIDHLKSLGEVFLFTEGDAVYQKLKIDKSGLTAKVDQSFLYEHKFDHILEIARIYEGQQLIFIDDKFDGLLEIKKIIPSSCCIEVCQGQYASHDHNSHPKLDKEVTEIKELLTLDFFALSSCRI